MWIAQEEAAAWFARLRAPDCRPEERAQFDHWLEQDARHAEAYAAVERLVRDLDLRARHDSRLQMMADQAMAMGGADGIITPVTAVVTAVVPARASGRRWQQIVPFAAAASIVLSLVLVMTLPRFMTEQGDAVAYASPLGEQRALTLDDGTLTSLDVDSEVTVKMTEQARAVNLVKGRAFFDVAHDAQRPFSVAVGDSRIVALGTRFQVQRKDHLVIVTLEEGSVDVVSEFEGKTLREQLKPGEQLRFNPDSDEWIKTTVETETVTSWSRGRHVFRNARLDDALEEVNRYAATKVRLGDPALADLTVSGNFIIGDSNVILSAFEAALPVRAVDGGSERILLPVYDQDGTLDPDRVQ